MDTLPPTGAFLTVGLWSMAQALPTLRRTLSTPAPPSILAWPDARRGARRARSWSCWGVGVGCVCEVFSLQGAANPDAEPLRCLPGRRHLDRSMTPGLVEGLKARKRSLIAQLRNPLLTDEERAGVRAKLAQVTAKLPKRKFLLTPEFVAGWQIRRASKGGSA